MSGIYLWLMYSPAKYPLINHLAISLVICHDTSCHVLLHILKICSQTEQQFSWADRVRESLRWLDNLITCRDESPVSAEAGCVSQCTAAGWRRPPAASFSGIIVCDWWLLRRHHRHCTEGQPSPAQLQTAVIPHSHNQTHAGGHLLGIPSTLYTLFTHITLLIC